MWWRARSDPALVETILLNTGRERASGCQRTGCIRPWRKQKLPCQERQKRGGELRMIICNGRSRMNGSAGFILCMLSRFFNSPYALDRILMADTPAVFYDPHHKGLLLYITVPAALAGALPDPPVAFILPGPFCFQLSEA